MAGTLKINHTSVWMPAGWVFDGVLEVITKELGVEHMSLSKVLRMGRTDISGYLDLRGLDGAQFRALLEAAERVHARVIAEGRQAFQDPSFYPGFVKHFSELIALLRSDARSVADAT